MENFDREPRTFNERVFLEIQKLATRMGFEINMIDDRAEEMRFQILKDVDSPTEEKNFLGFGEAEHKQFLEELFQTSTLLTPENTTLKVHPNHSINIIITPQ